MLKHVIPKLRIWVQIPIIILSILIGILFIPNNRIFYIQWDSNVYCIGNIEFIGKSLTTKKKSTQGLFWFAGFTLYYNTSGLEKFQIDFIKKHNAIPIDLYLNHKNLNYNKNWNYTIW